MHDAKNEMAAGMQRNDGAAFGLGFNYPNPYNPSTRIRFGIERSGYVSFKVFDVNGREVLTLVDGYMEAGTHEIGLTRAGLAAGIYICRLQSHGSLSTRKMELLK
jgi:hypothetical protein